MRLAVTEPIGAGLIGAGLIGVAGVCAALVFGVVARPVVLAQAPDGSAVSRGDYLANLGGCHDCHTPFKMGPQGPEPDMTLALSGHPAGVAMPPAPNPVGPWIWSGAATNTAFAGPWGVSYSPNLTPHQAGLGTWTEKMFIDAMRTGRHAGVGRPILPPMPWPNYARLSDADLKAIFAYLKSTRPQPNVPPPSVPTAGQ